MYINYFKNQIDNILVIFLFFQIMKNHLFLYMLFFQFMKINIYINIFLNHYEFDKYHTKHFLSTHKNPHMYNYFFIKNFHKIFYFHIISQNLSNLDLIMILIDELNKKYKINSYLYNIKFKK